MVSTSLGGKLAAIYLKSLKTVILAAAMYILNAGGAFAQTTVINPVNCGTASGGAGSGYATGGIGVYRNEIFWLDWSCGGVSQFDPGDIVTKSWNAGNGVIITAQLNNITEPISPYNTGNWSGDFLDNYYSGVNPIGLKNATNGIDPNFDITFTTTINGVTIPPSIVVSEAEDTGGGLNPLFGLPMVTHGSPLRPLVIWKSSSAMARVPCICKTL